MENSDRAFLIVTPASPFLLDDGLSSEFESENSSSEFSFSNVSLALAIFVVKLLKKLYLAIVFLFS